MSYTALWIAMWQQALKDETRQAYRCIRQELQRQGYSNHRITKAVTLIKDDIKQAVAQNIMFEYDRYPYNSERCYKYYELSQKAARQTGGRK